MPNNKYVFVWVNNRLIILCIDSNVKHWRYVWLLQNVQCTCMGIGYTIVGIVKIIILYYWLCNNCVVKYSIHYKFHILKRCKAIEPSYKLIGRYQCWYFVLIIFINVGDSKVQNVYHFIVYNNAGCTAYLKASITKF